MAQADGYVELDDAELERLARADAVALVTATTRQVLIWGKLLCPADTGRLRRSLRMTITRTPAGVDGAVTTNVRYARFVHDGTRRHLIRPRRPGGVLRFASPPHSGRYVFTRLVHHPGTRAQPFLRRALEQVARAEGFARGDG